MEVPITRFRREIFDLANRALAGETITVAYKGRRLRIVPENEPELQPETRFDRLTPMQILNPAYADLLDDAEMKTEMQAEWEKDWEEI